MTMKAHTYYIIFGRPPVGGSFPPFPPGGATVTGPASTWMGDRVYHLGMQPANKVNSALQCFRVA